MNPPLAHPGIVEFRIKNPNTLIRYGGSGFIAFICKEGCKGDSRNPRRSPLEWHDSIPALSKAKEKVEFSYRPGSRQFRQRSIWRVAALVSQPGMRRLASSNNIPSPASIIAYAEGSGTGASTPNNPWASSLGPAAK